MLTNMDVVDPPFVLDVSWPNAPQIQITPPTSAATGRMSMADPRPERSEIVPTNGGEMMSPSA